MARKKLKMQREGKGEGDAAREKPHKVRRGKRRQMFELQIKRGQEEKKGQRGRQGRDSKERKIGKGRQKERQQGQLVKRRLSFRFRFALVGKLSLSFFPLLSLY